AGARGRRGGAASAAGLARRVGPGWLGGLECAGDEWGGVGAELLGEHGGPGSRAGGAACRARMQPELEAGPRTFDVMSILLNVPVAKPALRPAASLVMHAGIDLLPPWAQRMLGVSAFAPLRRAVVRPGIRVVAPVLRWALVNGASKRARRRATAT
ncbi:DUF2236 domain-containing protein, partial [Burkholderia contaminans]